MGAVNISGYTFSTCSTYKSPAMRIADTHSTVTIQLTTRPRPAELSAQKVFTLSNSNYPFLRPLVTSTVITGYSGSLSKSSTSGYSGTSTKVSTSDTKADMSVSMSETMSWTATKTFTRTRSSTSGYTGVSSSSVNTTLETLCSTTSSQTTNYTSTYTKYAGNILTRSSGMASYVNTKLYMGQVGTTTGATSTTMFMGYTYGAGVSKHSISYNFASGSTASTAKSTWCTLVYSNPLISNKTMVFRHSNHYPTDITIASATTLTRALEGYNLSLTKSDNYVSIVMSTKSWQTCQIILAQAISNYYIDNYAYRVANFRSSGAAFDSVYAVTSKDVHYLLPFVSGLGFACAAFQSWTAQFLIGYTSNSLFCTTQTVTYTNFFSSTEKRSEYGLASYATQMNSVARDYSILSLSASAVGSISKSYYSSSAAVGNLSSITALTRASGYGSSTSNTASRSTSATKSWNDLNSTYTSASSTGQYDVSTISTKLASLWSTIAQFTSTAFTDVTSQGAMTTTARHLAGAMSRSYTFDYKTRQSSYQSSETNSNGAYTGIMSSTTALTRASYYSTTSSTIGALSSTTSLYTTSGV